MRSIIGDRLQRHLYVIGELAVVIEKRIRKVKVPFWLYLNNYHTDYRSVLWTAQTCWVWSLAKCPGFP